MSDFADALGADVVIPVTGLSIYTLRQQIVRLEHELKEANSEIGRHHNDFSRIRNILDYVEQDELMRQVALDGIRGIVG